MASKKKEKKVAQKEGKKAAYKHVHREPFERMNFLFQASVVPFVPATVVNAAYHLAC